MEYWGYLSREEYIERFEKIFPSGVCPEIDDFFSVSSGDIMRMIIEDSVPVGHLDVGRDSLEKIYDEYMIVSSVGMEWLLPVICHYVLRKKMDHEKFAEMIPLYIEIGFSENNFDLSFLNHQQKEMLFNLLEYCAETYDISVYQAQVKLTNYWN